MSLLLNKFIKNSYLLKNVQIVRNSKTLHIKPNFTKNNYDATRRNFNYLQPEHVSFFKKVLGERIVTDKSDLEKYNVDWFKNLRGSCSIVLKPKTTEEVSTILNFCNDNNLAVCPQGGNTSVVGGSIPVFDEVIVSTEMMNEIISVDDTSGVVVCQAGCILETLNNSLAEKGLIVPLDLGAKGSCHIGGNVSTNAGGLRMLRYGNLHGSVLGLEAVKANGEVVDCLSTLRKDNTGYHLKHLFIGSEGTLGFVTKVAIHCPPKPNYVNVAFLGLKSFERVLKTYKKAKQDLGEILSAIEVMDATTMEFLKETLNISSPIGDYPFYLLLETSGSHKNHDEEKLNTFLETSLDKWLVLNGTVASSPGKIKELWSIRESIPEGYKLTGFTFCYDVSLPLENYFSLVEDVKNHCGDNVERVYGFGHLGDGNLHIQIQAEEFTKEIKNLIEPFLLQRTKDLNGSISAEHGMGFLKAKYLDFAHPPNTVSLMKQLKQLLDPKGILNPYKIFP